MSREEVSYLGSARREEIRRQADEKERLRANPLLYLVSPQVKVIFMNRSVRLYRSRKTIIIYDHNSRICDGLSLASALCFSFDST